MRIFSCLLVVCVGCGSDTPAPAPIADSQASETSISAADIFDADPDSQTPADDVAVVNEATDPIVRLATLPMSTWPQGGGALASAADQLVVCDGDTVVVAPSTLDAPGVVTPLSALCRSVAASDDTAWVSTADGQWHRISSAGTTSVSAPPAHGLTVVGDYLVGAVGPKGLAVAPSSLASEPVVSALASDARAVAQVGDRLVVADGLSGAAVVQLGADGALSAVGSTPIPGISSGVAALSNQHAALAVGAVGLVVVDVSAEAPEIAGQATFQPKGMAMDVAVSDDGQLALVADWDRVRLVDVSDPTAPMVIAREVLDGGALAGHRAIGVEFDHDAFVTRGMDHVTRLAVDAAAFAPEIAVQPGASWVPAGPDGVVAAVMVFNTGRAPLEVTGITTQTATGRVSWLRPELPPNGSLTLPPGGFDLVEISVTGAEPLDTRVLFQSNDPDGHGGVLALAVNPTILAIGDPAPDFVIPTINGTMAQLSDYAGQVLYLRMFNAMCQSCLEVLPIIEAELWLEYGDQGLQPLAIHIGDALATAVEFQHKTQITFPMLLDFSRQVLRLYTRVGDSTYLFPLGYMIDRDSKIQAIHQDDEPDFDAMKAELELLLAE